MFILTIDVDAECPPELINRGGEAKVEAAAIREDHEELDRDRAAFRDKAPEDFVFGEADAFRDRLTVLLIRELKLRKGLAKIDADHRAELSRLWNSRAIPDLWSARKSIEKELLRIGFPPAADAGETDREKIMVQKLIDIHPRVVAAAGRVNQLQQASHANDFAQQNSAATKSLQARLKMHQETTSRI
jgi:hypothetical protein